MATSGLSGRVVLVTGTNNPKGIGAAIARAFANEGAKLVLAYRPAAAASRPAPEPTPGAAYYEWLQNQAPDALVGDIRAAGGEVETIEADRADAAQAASLLDTAAARFGPVDILVNNAPVSAEETFLPGAPQLTATSHDAHMVVNSRAAAILMAAFAGRRVTHGLTGGAIVKISTDAASGHAGAVSYGASKHALESYSRAAAWELGPLGIRVNAVAPGPVQTGWIEESRRAALEKAIPLRRLGDPADIADAVVFLASDQARWITGQVILVNGGHVMGL